ncbi:hypothetical protein [Paenibacillus naphthalenovorans]|uniref:hypothetical protein n=1 Tax=Paenibacillus naphthalenovorans TaxID=162209 RepID=UPI003F5CFC95
MRNDQIVASRLLTLQQGGCNPRRQRIAGKRIAEIFRALCSIQFSTAGVTSSADSIPHLPVLWISLKPA